VAYDPEYFRRELLPKLRGVKLADIAGARGGKAPRSGDAARVESLTAHIG